MTDLPITVHANGVSARSDEFMVWREPDDRGPFRTCGYCGSMHPEDFAGAVIAQGGHVELADMKYGWPHKVYLDVANPTPDRLYVTGRSTDASETYRPWSALTAVERDAARADGYDPDEPRNAEHIAVLHGQDREPGYAFGTHLSLHAKFYTLHLLEPGLSDDVKDQCFARIGLIIEPGERAGSVRWRPYVAHHPV